MRVQLIRVVLSAVLLFYLGLAYQESYVVLWYYKIIHG